MVILSKKKLEILVCNLYSFIHFIQFSPFLMLECSYMLDVSSVPLDVSLAPEGWFLRPPQTAYCGSGGRKGQYELETGGRSRTVMNFGWAAGDLRKTVGAAALSSWLGRFTSSQPVAVFLSKSTSFLFWAWRLTNYKISSLNFFGQAV